MTNLRRPVYIEPTSGEHVEMSPTQDVIALAGVTINGTPSAGTDATNVAYVQSVIPASSSPKTVEVTIPAIGAYEFTQSFTDASVTANSSISAQMSGQAATGKDQDETQMDDIMVRGWATGAGAFNIYLRGMEGLIGGSFRVAYQVGS